LKQWVADDCPDEYLDEFICLEGRGQYINDGCPCCKQEGELADFRCADCFGGELVCAKCCVRNHLHNPLHAIEVSHQAFMLHLSAHPLHRNGQANSTSRQHWPILAFEYSLDTPPAIPVQIRNLHLETLPSSIRTVFTMSHLITANATSTRVLAPTVSSSYGVDFFPQPTRNPSHVRPLQYCSSFICKTSRAKSLVTTSIRLWRS
jgi:hypothetical protein